MPLTGFSTSSPTVVLKGGKPHDLISRRSADWLNNLSCVRISEWKYTFQVTYILVATTSFHLNRWRCQFGGAELCSEKINVEVNIRTRHIIYHVTSILKVTILHLLIDLFIYCINLSIRFIYLFSLPIFSHLNKLFNHAKQLYDFANNLVYILPSFIFCINLL